jgi:hypothetical protein
MRLGITAVGLAEIALCRQRSLPITVGAVMPITCLCQRPSPVEAEAYAVDALTVARDLRC